MPLVSFYFLPGTIHIVKLYYHKIEKAEIKYNY